ncbi:MAG: hypothetical protein OXC96_10020 [Cyanobacteria bacterium MAG CAR1_bin_15]|nr:hypothetical protein [Cyanobacteria bacterium MAG CAR1_bin_15]
MLGKQLVHRKLIVDTGIGQPAAVTSASAQDMPYAPISSVWEGSDAELLEEMFRFYPSIAVEPILDATHNAGRFWRNSKRRVVSMDIDPQYKPMIVADNRNMVGVKDASFGVVVYNPPMWNRRAGTKVASGLTWTLAPPCPVARLKTGP